MDALLAPEGPEVAQRASLAAALLAVDPVGLGGVLLRAVRADASQAWLDALRELLPGGAPVMRLPVGIPDDRLLGGLDLAMTLATGRPVSERGLLSRADGGVVVMPNAERASPGLIGRLAAALDTGVVPPRGPSDEPSPARLALVAIDESEPDEEPVAAALADRLAFSLTVTPGDVATPLSRDEVRSARALFASVRVTDAQVATLVGVGAAFGVDSLRATSIAMRAARACAALDGRGQVRDDDLATAATLVLGPRATRRPVPEEQHAEEPPEQARPPEPQAEQDDASPDSLEESKGLEDRLIAAVTTALPLTLHSEQSGARRPAGAKEGRAGGDRAGGKRGRQVGTRRGDPRAGGRLDLLETLRAAAPWQRVRGGLDAPAAARLATQAGPRASVRRSRILVRVDDFRLRHLVEPAGTTAIFVVDASGSAAVARLGEAKGAVELLLADAYSRRDEVGVIAFRGTTAEVLLAPTRAVAAAKRALAALPGGGGTPLASAIDRAREQVIQARRLGNDTVVVFLTDARANIARDGTPGRAQAEADAKASAQALRALAGTTLFIDTSTRPAPQAQAMAQLLGARYVALPRTDARGIHAAVSAAMPVRRA